jgi:hypothetical protein
MPVGNNWSRKGKIDKRWGIKVIGIIDNHAPTVKPVSKKILELCLQLIGWFLSDLSR